MPLVHFCGRTPAGKNFSIGFAFGTSESEVQYTWVLEQFKLAVYSDYNPLAIITDDEGALTLGLEQIFQGVPHMLYKWHVEKNILTEAQKV